MKPFTVIGQRKEDETNKQKRLCHIFAASGQFKVQWLRIWFIKEWNGVVRQNNKEKKINFNANEVGFLPSCSNQIEAYFSLCIINDEHVSFLNFW